MNNIKFNCILIAFFFTSFTLASQLRANEAQTIEFENQYVKYVIAADGRNLNFLDKQTGIDYCANRPSKFTRLMKEGQSYDASSVSYSDGHMTVQFGRSGVSAIITVTEKKHHFIFEVSSISDKQVEELVFIDLNTNCKESPEDTFAGCALALNLQTKVNELPGPNNRLQASCYPRFGLVGAKVAIIGCPKPSLRDVMKEVVSEAEGLPHSPYGGPWSLDATEFRGSTLAGNPTEETVDDWIRLAKNLGMNQISFRNSWPLWRDIIRQGDCQPNPELYPRGKASLKAVIDRLHTAGIKAGLHTWAFFINKECPWVRPVPDPRLDKDATFTLARPLTTGDTVVPVVEPAEDITNFYVEYHGSGKSVTLQIDNELIRYSGVSKQKPYGFTECERGALGTKATPHAKEAKVYHLKECWGAFVPAGDSTLLSEAAACTAEVFNDCGFDMIYLDALDGEGIIAGRENGWYYGSKFVFEIWKRLKRPAFMEMSIFHHHLWFVRSRMCAWDVPSRSYKKFIDIHCEANQGCEHIYMPKHLGWWAARTAILSPGPTINTTFPDDFEYLCSKCLAHDASFAFVGLRTDPADFMKNPFNRRLAKIIKQYETLRLENYFPEPVREQLKIPGAEFTLEQNRRGQWQLRPVQYTKHKVENIDGITNVWQVKNSYGRQPAKLRIEVLLSASPYDSPDNLILADFSDPCDLTDRETAPSIKAILKQSSLHTKNASVSARYTASNISLKSQVETSGYVKHSLFEHGARVSRPKPATWAKAGKTLSPPLDLSNHQGIGVWIYGDGKGEILNFQIRSPKYIAYGTIGERYVTVDFTGWRYFELIEFEGGRFEHYTWPYGDSVYATYRSPARYESVDRFSLWYNNIPASETVTCYISPIKALPLVKAKLHNSSVTIGDKTIVFPVEIESGCYLEFNSFVDCTLYSIEGQILCDVQPKGDVPILREGENQVRFDCSIEGRFRPRVNVTVISQDETTLQK